MKTKLELPPMDLYSAATSPLVFRSYFRDIGTWSSWLTFSKLLAGRKDFSAYERALIRECAGLTELPAVPIRECFIIAGRRSGKSTWTAMLACYYAIFGGWEKYLSRGETARIFIVATNTAQGQIVKKYLDAFFELTPTLRQLVKRKLAESIELRSGVTIEIKPASWRTSRGFSVGMLIMEELAFFRYADADTVNPDKEIYLSIVPSMATIKNSLTVGISTPMARQGLLYQKFSRHFGKPGPVLIWRAPTWVMNRELKESELEEQYRESLGDAAYLAEYACQWRSDIETYLTEELIDLAMNGQPLWRPYSPAFTYYAGCDPAELVHKGGDSMTLAIAHKDGDRSVLDLVEEIRPPANPKDVIKRFAQICRDYGVRVITEDRVSIGWIRSDFEPLSIEVVPAEDTKSVLYERLAVLASKKVVDLLDLPRLRTQLGTLETRVGSAGKVSIDHISGGHDDVVNAAALALCEAGRDLNVVVNWKAIGDIGNCHPDENERRQPDFPYSSIRADRPAWSAPVDRVDGPPRRSRELPFRSPVDRVDPAGGDTGTYDEWSKRNPPSGRR